MSVERLPEAVYADATACRDREMPGVPPNPLPFWVSFPLLNKLPVPSVMPRRALFMHTCRMGETMWRTQENFDFDLTDPNLYTYPATLRYNSLYDKTLRGYFANPRVHKHLLRHGLVTRDGRVPCQLKEFNGFRHYLHRHNVRIVQTNHELHEPYIVKQMLKTAISSYREEQDRTCDITARFSRHLNLHAPPMEDENDQRLEEFLVDQGNTEGEVKWCKWLNRIYQEDCRKAALMRLRRIQDYVVKQRKIWVSWRKRNLFDLEWLAEEKRKAEDLERERLKHVAEHMRRTSVYQARMLERIRVASEEKAAEIHAMTIAVGKHICAKACRLWPLSARCPVAVEYGTGSGRRVEREPLPASCVSGKASGSRGHEHATPARQSSLTARSRPAVQL